MNARWLQWLKLLIYPLISITQANTLNPLFLLKQLMLNNSPCEVFAVSQFFYGLFFFFIKSGFIGQMSLQILKTRDVMPTYQTLRIEKSSDISF